MSAITTSTPIPTGTTWTVDPVHSTVGFAVKHMVVSTFRGSFEDYDATLTASEDGTLRLEGRVSADSIAVKDDNLATHLKAPDFFDTERHPYVTFSSTLVRAENGSLVVDGELTIKGNSRPIEARGVDHRAARDLRRRREGRPRARGDRRSHRVRPRLERPAAQGRLRPRQRGQAPDQPRTGPAGVVMKVLGLSGSLRAGSHNSKLLRAAGDLLPGEAELVEFDGLKLIPPFDEDDEHTRPDEVQALFDAIASADAVLVATPEYNHSIPGQLKNALDWLSRPLAESPLRNKPDRGRRHLHRPLRRGLGPGRGPQGPLRHRRPRHRPRAPDRPRRRRLHARRHPHGRGPLPGPRRHPRRAPRRDPSPPSKLP